MSEEIKNSELKETELKEEDLEKVSGGAAYARAVSDTEKVPKGGAIYNNGTRNGIVGPIRRSE